MFIPMSASGPICPHCGEPMEEVEGPTVEFPGGTWRCPVGVRQQEDIGRRLAAAAARALDALDPGA